MKNWESERPARVARPRRSRSQHPPIVWRCVESRYDPCHSIL